MHKQIWLQRTQKANPPIGKDLRDMGVGQYFTLQTMEG